MKKHALGYSQDMPENMFKKQVYGFPSVHDRHVMRPITVDFQYIFR